MRYRILGLVVVAAVVLLGCGGRAVGGGSSGSSDSSDGKTDPTTTPPNDSSSSSGDLDLVADTELGSCKLGPLETSNFDTPCPWVAKERCYETHDMACNCACPRSHDSQCVSGFGVGPNGHVLVSCF